MNKKNKHTKLAFTPILTIVVSAIVAACFYASVYIIIQSIRTDIANNAADSITPKLSNLNYTAVIGFSAIVIIYACIQIINYFALARPFRGLQSEEIEKNLQASIEISSRIEKIHNYLIEGGDAAGRLEERLGEQTGALTETRDGLSKIGTTARQLFVNSAAIDNAVAQIAKSVESLQNSVHEGIAAASPASPASPAPSPVETAVNITTPGDMNTMKITAPGDMNDDIEAFGRLLIDVDNYIGMVNRAGEHLNQRIAACAEIVRTATIQANQLSLNAAVESAKAGEAGRGFVYVAEDIRTHADGLRKANAEIHGAATQVDSRSDLITRLEESLASAKRALLSVARTTSAPVSAAVKIEDKISAPEDAYAAADDADAVINDTYVAVDDADDIANDTNVAVDDTDTSADDANGAVDDAEKPAANESAADSKGNSISGSSISDATGSPNPSGAPVSDGTTVSNGAPVSNGAVAPAAINETPAPDKTANTSRHRAKWEKEIDAIYKDLDAIRIAIRTVGAALAESSDTAASEIKRIDMLSTMNNEIMESVKKLASLLEQAEII